MKKLCVVFILFFLLFLSGCKVKNSYTLNSTYEELKELTERSDSQLSNEQLIKKNMLFTIVKESVRVEDNRFHNYSKPKDFENNKLSRFYFDILEKSVNDANKAIDIDKVTNVDSLYQQSIIDLFNNK
ncbi:MAG: hypothetical protein PHS04_12375 [Tissierellia bacterium]|nr:hypothetical protein [Tissierellia bacterium]